MEIESLKQEIDRQHEVNLARWGEQPRPTLILEIEDQVGKLRDAFLHRTDSQVRRRIVNIGSLLWAIGKNLPDSWMPERPGQEEPARKGAEQP